MVNEQLIAIEKLYLTKLRSTLQYGLDDILISIDALKIRNLITILEKEISNYLTPQNNDTGRNKNT